MLTDEEKVRIRDEEAFRKEVRDQLFPVTPKSSKQKVWDALNSNFGMWLLSAVLVSGLGTAYTRYQSRVDAERKEKFEALIEARRIADIRDRLRLEIAYRVSATLTRLDDLNRLAGGQSAALVDSRKIQQALAPLALPASDSMPPLFPEHKAHSGVALIAELRRYSEDGSKQNLKAALTRTAGLLNEVYGEVASESRSPQATAIALLQRVREAVPDSGFPFLDCPDNKPFC